MIDPLWLIERDAIIEALEYFNGNRTETARALEISVRSLRNKIRTYQAQGFDIPEADGLSKFGTYESPKNERPAPIKCQESPELL